MHKELRPHTPGRTEGRQQGPAASTVFEQVCTSSKALTASCTMSLRPHAPVRTEGRQQGPAVSIFFLTGVH